LTDDAITSNNVGLLHGVEYAESRAVSANVV